MCNLVCFTICLAACQPVVKTQLLSTPEGRDWIFQSVDRDFRRLEILHLELQRLMEQMRVHNERGRLFSQEAVRLASLPTSEEVQKQAKELGIQLRRHHERTKEMDKVWTDFERRLRALEK